MLIRLIPMLLIGLTLTACGLPKTPEDHANRFFDHGRQQIIASLKKQDLSEDALNAARDIIAQHEDTVREKLTASMRDRHALFSNLVGGADAHTLLQLQAKLDASQGEALQAIGALHEALAASVGEQVWRSAGAYRKDKLRRHFGDANVAE